MARLFIAAWPSADTTERLAGITRPVEPGVKWVRQENWHVTLRFLGEAEVDEVVGRLAGILPSATARLGPTIERLDRRQLVVPVDGVDALAAAVQSATADLGVPDRRQFRGHLTVARLKPDAVSSQLGAPFAAQFDVDEIALVSSELLPTGAVYSSVARFATE